MWHRLQRSNRRPDGFRNYLRDARGLSEEDCCLDRAQLLKLTAPEMTVLVGRPGAVLNLPRWKKVRSRRVLPSGRRRWTNDFFVNLLDMNTIWQKSPASDNVLKDEITAGGRSSGPGTRVPISFSAPTLSFGQLPKCTRVVDAKEKFIHDFVCSVGTKVMISIASIWRELLVPK